MKCLLIRSGSKVTTVTDMAEASEQWEGEGEGAGRFFKWIPGHTPPERFKNKFPSLLIKFIVIIDGKYKTRQVGFFCDVYLKIYSIIGDRVPPSPVPLCVCNNVKLSTQCVIYVFEYTDRFSHHVCEFVCVWGDV